MPAYRAFYTYLVSCFPGSFNFIFSKFLESSIVECVFNSESEFLLIVECVLNSESEFLLVGRNAFFVSP